MKRPLAFLPLLFLVLSCDGSSDSPTDPSCSPRAVFAHEQFYQERSEPQVVIRGLLRKECQPPSPNSRNHCYWFGATPVYSGSAQSAAIFDQYVNTRTVILGKRVDVGFGEEIWTGTISCE